MIDEGETLEQYRTEIYDNPYICTHGMLRLIEFNASRAEPQLIQFYYNGTGGGVISAGQVHVTVHPN